MTAVFTGAEQFTLDWVRHSTREAVVHYVVAMTTEEDQKSPAETGGHFGSGIWTDRRTDKAEETSMWRHHRSIYCTEVWPDLLLHCITEGFQQQDAAEQLERCRVHPSSTRAKHTWFKISLGVTHRRIDKVKLRVTWPARLFARSSEDEGKKGCCTENDPTNNDNKDTAVNIQPDERLFQATQQNGYWWSATSVPSCTVQLLESVS